MAIPIVYNFRSVKSRWTSTIVAVVGIEHGKADDLPERWPAESQDGCPWLARGCEELPVKSSARDPVFEGVVETMDKDEEITARVGQVVPQCLVCEAQRPSTADLGAVVRLRSEGRRRDSEL